MMKKLTIAALAAVVMLGLAGCGGGGDSGPSFTEVKITWTLTGTICSQTDIDKIQVDLFTDGERILTRDAACGDGQVLIQDVETGLYEVRVQGLDQDGMVLYEGILEEFDVDSGDEPATPDAPIALALKEAVLQLRWAFPPDASNCAFSGIANVEIGITHDETGMSLFNGSFPCELDPEAEDNPAPIIDGWIEVSGIPGGSKVNVVFFGLDESGARLYVGETSTEVPKAGAKQLIVTLEACDGNCV